MVAVSPVLMELLAALSAFFPIQAGVHANPIQPRRKLGVPAKAVKLPISAEENFLGEVLSVG